jgi:hypothetical protein
VTAPPAVRDGTWARLTVVAAWDTSLIRGAVSTLAAVSARLPAWRMRLGEVARSLDDPACWAGPAATGATAAVFELSAAAAAVDGALTESLHDLERLAARAGSAGELALQAVRSGHAAELGADLTAHDRLASVIDALAPGATATLPPSLAVAAEALEDAAAAASSASSAREPLARLGGLDAWSSVTFWDVVAAVGLVGPVAPPAVPRGKSPEAVAGWWAALSAGAQLAVLRSAPAAVGGLDGVPAWARDRANRVLLARALEDPGTPPYAAFVAAVVNRQIAVQEAAGRRMQLQLLDLAGDRVVLAVGDLDTADAVALLVPGIWNSPGDDLGRLTRDAVEVGDAARAAAPAMAVATVVWLGYRPPSTLPGIATRGAANRGGTALARSLDGVAARAVGGMPRPRATVVAHSYGTVVVDEAADVPGPLRADAVVLLGSPGMEDDARSLEAPEVFDLAAQDDLIAKLRHFGRSTGDGEFGSVALPGDPSMGHSDYYDPGHPTLPAIGEVVAGVRVP